jgi:DNA processing protein
VAEPAAPPDDPRPYWVGFNRVPGVGVQRLRRLIDAFGDVRSAWEAPSGQLAASGLRGGALEALLDLRRKLDLGAEMGRLAERGVAVVTIDDPAYPARLREIYGAPPLLFVRGQLPPAGASLLSVVGTRQATAYGRAVTEQIVGDLARQGVWIVSGFARGVDTHAHRAALAAGGRTIAVVACGLDTVYPPENRDLAAAVPRQGALISELPLGARPEARNFPARNRIVAGVSPATLVVEAGERSGALITAEFALAQGREVLAVPGPITSPRSVGTNRLIQDGARLVQSAEEVRSELGLQGEAQKASQLRLAELMPLDPDEQAVVARLAAEPLLTDDLAQALGRPIQEVQATLTMLELKGQVRQVAGLNYLIQSGSEHSWQRASARRSWSSSSRRRRPGRWASSLARPTPFDRRSAIYGICRRTGSASTSSATSSPATSCPRARRTWSSRCAPRRGPPARSFWRPTRIARARPSPGTSSRR